ncbi:TRAP transporter large permease subunit [Bordetella bronchiseptica]|uniref:TRAP transporter large permease n=1 Tax=Bordetella bronchiseptica TaxID=518 RepID=UPI000F68ABD7|nr:TRAP transporter large permease subunit [Bordetella bronchiseptica]RSC00879.1 TRAP transporter large permease subunit [Bordetella bronchiseptica]RSC05478.1 TRAP transporter large permease subunit [Bordetella bronchiseptica]
MIAITVVTAALLLLFLGASIWVSLSLFGAAYFLLLLFKPNLPLDVLAGQIVWTASTSQELLSLPLFVLMGEILAKTSVGRSLFAGLAPWVGRLPGGLTHVNVLGCTLFAAICGSSVATTQIVGRVTLPELQQRGYDARLSIGSLAGAGTLGFLIPPSLIMIVYGVLAEQSIVELFIAGVLPGLGLAAVYMAYIALRGQRPDGAAPGYTLRERIAGLTQILPVIGLIAAIMGALYLGIAGPSEVAAVGVLGALAIGLLQRSLTRASLVAAGRSAVRTCSMIGLILAGAALISVAMSYLGLPKYVAARIGELGLSPLLLIALLLLFYVVLGMFLDGTSIIVLTLPIALPLVVAAGYDAIWFGIFLVVVVEMAQITPPVGFNLFVIQSITGRPLSFVARATLPFFLLLLAWAMALAVWPEIVLWLPGTLRN